MYRLKFHEKALKDFEKIAKPYQILIKEKLLILSENPKVLANQITRLKGTQDEPLYRLRVGSYRVIFFKKFEELIIIIIRIGYRKDVYEGF